MQVGYTWPVVRAYGRAGLEMVNNSDSIRFLIMFGAGAIVMVIFIISMQLRRKKYRSIAEELGAEYQSQGIFKGGEILGSREGRPFTMLTQDTGRGRGSSNWTSVTMHCSNQSIPLEMEGSFFKNFPDWKHAFTIGDRSQKVLGATIALQGVPIPLEEKYHAQVEALFQEVALVQKDLLKKGYVRIQQDQVMFKFHGVLKNADEARQSLALLADLARRIESNPVC